MSTKKYNKHSTQVKPFENKFSLQKKKGKWNIAKIKEQTKVITSKLGVEYDWDKVVLLYPIDKWILMLLEYGAEVRNLKDIKWLAIEDNTPGKGTGRHIACFILGDNNKKVN